MIQLKFNSVISQNVKVSAIFLKGCKIQMKKIPLKPGFYILETVSWNTVKLKQF